VGVDQLLIMFSKRNNPLWTPVTTRWQQRSFVKSDSSGNTTS